jgi:hypothetical protein
LGDQVFGKGRLTTLLAVTAALLPGVLVAPSPAEATIPSCPGHCYGIASYNQYDNLEAVGGNLSVACLHVPDRDNHFVNMEMWLTTRADRSATNWVEAGMTAGTLYASPGHEKGFIWYWADAYTDIGAYFEHYIGLASANVFTNVSFYWEPNSSGVWGWGVYTGGVRRGWSGVGAYPGRVDVGAESTDGNIAVWGDAVEWQYRDKARNWHWIFPSPLVQGTAIYSSSPGLGRVSVWTPQWRCGGPGPAAAPAALSSAAAEQARQLMQTPQGTRQQLQEMVKHLAAAHGNGDLGSGHYVKTTRGAALRQNGGTEVIDSRPVYVVQLGGNFQKQSQHHGIVAGNSLEVVVDAATGEVTDWGLTASAQDLGRLGPMQSLT